MKEKLKILFVTLLCLFLLPLNVKAETYNTLDLRGALKEEGIEEKFKNYKPADDAITIYLFRGKGCGFCRAYLEFMNSIADEYGKYFKLESYEVWNDSKNSALMTEVSTYMGEAAGGVPYIVIGDKVFPGYNESYNEGIIDAITTLYNTKKKKRYDVFAEMKKHPNKNSSNTSSGDNTLLWNFIFAFVATFIIVTYTNLKYRELSAKVEQLSTKIEQLSVKEKSTRSTKKDNKKKV